VWFEPDDTRERVDELLDRAANLGFGQIRVFLMWPWIQADSGSSWDFRLWDDVFDSAATRGIGIKATLTANSGPWWLDTGSVLHSHTLVLKENWWPAVDSYIDACVRRYSEHPALRQWLLWNEPVAPFDRMRSPELRPDNVHGLWIDLLEQRFNGQIDDLNARWRTGYGAFADVPFWEQTHLAVHDNQPWRSFGPLMADAELRSTVLEQQLSHIARRVRAIDTITPMCANPNKSLSNHAFNGVRLDRMASIVDVLGASFHAPWEFGYARPSEHNGLVVAGMTLLDSIAPGRAEVTEFQTGNTFYAGLDAIGSEGSTVASAYLQPLLAGAQSVTGWCFNTRRKDFEAGEWGLLDDNDSVGPRARAVSDVRDVLSRLDARLGSWSASPKTAAVLVGDHDHAVQFAISEVSHSKWGVSPDAGSRAAAMTAIALSRLGVQAGLADIHRLGEEDNHELIIATHLTAWSDDEAIALLRCAERGATVVLDATTGQFDEDAALSNPWPGGIAEAIGLRSTGLHTSTSGDGTFGVRLNGIDIGPIEGVRGRPSFEDLAWVPRCDVTFGDATPVVWVRQWGSGQVVYSCAAIGLSLLSSHVAAATAILAEVAASHVGEEQPLSPDTQLEYVESPSGRAIGVFAQSGVARGGLPVVLRVSPGMYEDLWSGIAYEVGTDQLLELAAPEGIALLVQQNVGEV